MVYMNVWRDDCKVVVKGCKMAGDDRLTSRLKGYKKRMVMSPLHLPINMTKL